MYTHGVDPILDFSNLPDIIKLSESVTEMKVYDRQPYAGKFVFAAFSGSHQDAISKGLKYHKTNKLATWSVPYLPLDPKDVSREYSADVIRINSQSGKGGIAYILETNFGLNIPPKMRETVGYTVKDVSDKEHKELTPSDVQTIFVENFVNLKTPLKMLEYHFIREGAVFKVMISTEWNGVRKDYLAEGSGRLDAVSNAIKECYNIDYVLTNYNEHALESTSKSEAAAYVSVKIGDKETWGSGIHEDIICASIYALVSAINNQYK
jgi:2-isopropylmalate synthase